MTIIPETCRV